MDIEQFYTENEVRRSSAEFEFGSRWTDERGYLYELSWIESTGELYLMAVPSAELVGDPMGDAVALPEPVVELTVRVVATLATVQDVESALVGWESAMGEMNSVTWLEAHLGFDWNN